MCVKLPSQLKLQKSHFQGLSDLKLDYHIVDDFPV